MTRRASDHPPTVPFIGEVSSNKTGLSIKPVRRPYGKSCYFFSVPLCVPLREGHAIQEGAQAWSDDADCSKSK